MALKRTRKRRGASITSLIDVIFLLLLFFMLASTFSKRAEIELLSSAQGQGSAQLEPGDVIRLEISADQLRLDGRLVQSAELSRVLAAQYALEEQVIAVDPGEDVSTQRLVDTLMALRSVSGARVHVVEPS